MKIIDAHLDLSHNALKGRDVFKPAVEQPADRGGIPTVGLPDLARGNVALICATIFCAPASDGEQGYKTPAEAHQAGLKHLHWYQQAADKGIFRFVRSPADLDVPPASPTPAQEIILLLEGADPLRSADDLAVWFDAGLRIIGLAWHETRYAGGTGAPGPLKPASIPIIEGMDQLGLIHDLSHLAEESFWQLLKIACGPVMASHSNCRSIVPTDRQLSDDMIRAVIDRGGVIGINFYDKFLLPPDQYGKRRATLADVVAHARHICDLAGNCNHVAIGTDMDGGLGRNEIPIEIETSADLFKLAEVLEQSGFAPDDVQSIMGGNWMRFFRSNLPSVPAPA
jgi:membrane dipeptidase